MAEGQKIKAKMESNGVKILFIGLPPKICINPKSQANSNFKIPKRGGDPLFKFRKYYTIMTVRKAREISILNVEFWKIFVARKGAEI
jgi:hypothetical protein